MERIPEPIKLEKIETITEGRPDDVFICCGSPEERCKGTIMKLSPNYKSNAVFLLRYTDHGSQKRERNIKEMKGKLDIVGEIVEIPVDERKPLALLMDIIQNIEQYALEPEKPRVTIDISTIIKWHLLIFFKALDLRYPQKEVRILYTEPKDYVTELFQPLSFGIDKIFPIPTCSGYYDFSKDSLLVLLLGYEGDRALAIFEEVDPADCLLLISKPAYHEEWEGRTEEMNKGIINIVGKSKIKYVDSRNSVLVAHQLYDILSNSLYSEYNHIISPLGTKPQTLGLHLYLSTKPPNTSLIYGSPLRHNEPFYSHGIGGTWVLQFNRITVGNKNESQKPEF